MTPPVSVIVPTHNRAGLLEQTLTALLDDPATSELIVVADRPDPATTSLLTRLSRSDQRVRPAGPKEGETGAGPARQAGAELARHEIVLFIDDDVVAESGLVTGHAQHHADGRHRIVVGYMPVVPTDDVTRARDLGVVRYSNSYETRCRLFDRSPEHILTRFWAGNFSMRRADALEVGLSDPLVVRAYQEDRDFGLRCYAAGVEAVFDRSLQARHYYRRSWRQMHSDSRRLGIGTMLIEARHPVGGRPKRRSDRSGAGPFRRHLFAASRRPRARALVQAALGAFVELMCVAGRPELASRATTISLSISRHQGAAEVLAEGKLPPPHQSWEPSTAPPRPASSVRG